jgi:hypothetical protein
LYLTYVAISLAFQVGLIINEFNNKFPIAKVAANNTIETYNVVATEKFLRYIAESISVALT